ncbi:TPA: hypothetical protein ACK3Q6_004488 [Burkholderia cepacia]
MAVTEIEQANEIARLRAELDELKARAVDVRRATKQFASFVHITVGARNDERTMDNLRALQDVVLLLERP